VTIRGPFAVILLMLLFVSLAANFLVAGFVAARVSGPLPAADIERLVALAARGFPPEIQHAIADATKAARPQLRDRLQAVQQAKQQMFAAMTAQPFSQQTLDTAFTTYRDATAALQKAGQDVVEQAVAEAPPDVRRKIKVPAPVRLPAT
jgi:uncharacterized membrane protein